MLYDLKEKTFHDHYIVVDAPQRHIHSKCGSFKVIVKTSMHISSFVQLFVF